MLPRHKRTSLRQAKSRSNQMQSQGHDGITAGARGNLAGSDWVERRPTLASTVYVNDSKRGKTVERFVCQIGWHCRLLSWYQTQHNEKKENDDCDCNKERRSSLCVCTCGSCCHTSSSLSLSHTHTRLLTRSPTGTHYPHRNAIHNKSTSLRATLDGFPSIIGNLTSHCLETQRPPSSTAPTDDDCNRIRQRP